MPDLYNHYRVFISSPSDVAAERQFSEEVVSAINKTCSDTLRSALETRKWEDLPAQTPYMPENQIQDVIDKEVEKAHFFVLILYKRYGSIEFGNTKSNTERELDTILERYRTNPQLRILCYFRDVPDNSDPGKQEQQVKDFRSRLESMGILYKRYSTPEEFKNIFTHDMYNVLLRMRLSPFKQEMLRRFWKIGDASRPTYPKLAILFPSVSHKFMNFSNGRAWLLRLEPYMYFEDFKAIHKIMKLLSLTGFTAYKVYFYTDLPRDLRFMNKVWTCFPRSRAALETLKGYGQRPKFNFKLRQNVSSELIWRNSNNEQITINSPISDYLCIQRKKIDLTGEPTSHHRRIIAKDYAILARFKNDLNPEITEEGFLYDYFFAGIRGLGTWGTAWFIDRKAKLLIDLPEEGDIQFLLEVTYKDGGIADVIDVSDYPAEYFEEQNDTTHIREQILNYRES